MLLKVKAGPRNYRPDVTPPGKVHLGDLSDRGVRFFRLSGSHSKTDSRSLGVSPHFGTSIVYPPGGGSSSTDKLAKRRHVQTTREDDQEG